MRVTSIRDLLAAQALFTGLEPGDLDLLAGCGRNEVFEAGSLLAREGAPAERFFLVRHGHVALQLHASGGPLTIETAGPGEVIGWSWLFPPYRWSTDAEALETTRVVAIEGLCLRDKCDIDPVFGYRIMQRFAQIMAHRIDAAHLRLLDLYGTGRAS